MRATALRNSGFAIVFGCAITIGLQLSAVSAGGLPGKWQPYRPPIASVAAGASVHPIAPFAGLAGALSKTSQIHNLNSGLLHIGDIPKYPGQIVGTRPETHRVYPSYDKDMTTEGALGGSYCFPPSSFRAGWKQGIAQDVFDLKGMEFTLCGYLFASNTAAHTHYLELTRVFVKAIHQHQVEALRLPKAGNERIGYQLPLVSRYLGVFRLNNAVISIKAVGFPGTYSGKRFGNLLLLTSLRLK